ncbi:MAG TPA: diacylglycerol kinase family protein, partial [Bacteroidales bacterium]|nr:diacylglycerol kinase family protein [Bacteroidales bacterium]
LFIINPLSGNRNKTHLKEEIIRHCKNHGLVPFFGELSGGNDKEKIIAALEVKNPDIAVAVGGDGTVNLVASALINKSVKLGIIPTGSANGMAYELNIPVNIEHAVAILAKNISKRIDLLMINGKHLTVHLSDLGMNARIIKRFDQEKIRGFYGYARQFFKELKSPSYFRCIIQCKGNRARKYKAVMVVMLNTHFFGTGAVVNPTGKIDDGIFEIVVIKPYPWYYIFRMLFAFFTGNIHRLRHVRIISCKQAKITMLHPQELQVDGEPTGEFRNLEVKSLPAALEVIYNPEQEFSFFRPHLGRKTRQP